jgi:hypothetical protein
MFKKNTLFVVGAGASAELDLPLSSLLATRISAKMNICCSLSLIPIDQRLARLPHASRLTMRCWITMSRCRRLLPGSQN